MNILDRIIGAISPEWGVRRYSARATLQQIDAVTGGAKGGYNAGKLNRFSLGRMPAETKEHAVPSSQIERLVAQSWDLYRNNTYARKIVRSCESKVIGRGMQPESLAINPDGTPNVAFRAASKTLWAQIQSGFDARGLPGKGGQTFGGMQRLALRATMLSGETLYRLVPLDPTERIVRDIPIPLALQLIDCSRLANATDVPAESITGNNQLYRGIELDGRGMRVAYWINAVRPGESTPAFTTAKRRPAAEIGHVFVEDDLDQIRGTPWFAAALLQMRDTGDLQYNVLKASAMAACIVLGYRKPTGSTRFGLNPASEGSSTSADGTDLTDGDGNAITKISPGMFVNLGRDGELQGFSPNQPNMNAEAFIGHMLRGTAAGFPGLKASTVTGDYRNSSFSSERSAENDNWPEVVALQEWFAASFCQPIYESVLRSAILSGYFTGLVDARAFLEMPSRFTAVHWQGPVSLSINPVDDVEAAAKRVKYGQSSLQMECAKINVNWIDVLNHAAELYATAAEKGLMPEVVNNIMGVDSSDVVAQVTKSQAEMPVDATPDAEEAPVIE